jgi:hypothetical protein
MGQSALLTSFAVPDMEAWKIHSLFELMGCVFAVCSRSNRRLQFALSVRFLFTLCIIYAGCNWVRRDVLPAVVVHNGEGPSLLGHVQPSLHRHHHRARHPRPPRAATRWKVRL